MFDVSLPRSVDRGPADIQPGSDLPIAAALVSRIVGGELLVVEGIHFRKLQERCAELEKIVAKIVPIDKLRAA